MKCAKQALSHYIELHYVAYMLLYLLSYDLFLSVISFLQFTF